MITIIAAVARNRAIGFENKLIYWLPNDLKRFKALTTGHTIVMGRNTFLSLPKGALPNRRNIVLSRTKRELPGCETYASIDEALRHCRNDEDIYIIGGASVYRQAMKLADRLCLTEVDDTLPRLQRLARAVARRPRRRRASCPCLLVCRLHKVTLILLPLARPSWLSS